MSQPPRRAADIDLDQLRADGTFFPSPSSWSDQTLYFLLVDRFSDGKEIGVEDADEHLIAGGETPLAKVEDRGNAFKTEDDAERWRQAGGRFVGGTLQGLKSKLGYLKRLGVTAIWVSPLLKQAVWSQDYHGYGTQDFLQIEPRMGTGDDLKEMVAEAHALGMRVILDIVLNHAANVFSYEQGGAWNGHEFPVKGWNDAQCQPTVPFGKTDPDAPETWPDFDAAVWPVELQDPAAFTRKGGISNWDHDPEFLEGDFFEFRDFNHGEGGLEDYRPSEALKVLTKIYKYWIAFADLDGFRIDTVKHMEPGAVRYFSREIQEFAETLGKEDFFLVGEITGGRGFAVDVMGQTGLDAALGISGESLVLEKAATGQVAPTDFFALFHRSDEVPDGTDTWFRNHLVTIIDDHDQVARGTGNKARFCADPEAAPLALTAFALNVLTLGIPCVYYGSEQGFDGRGQGNDAERYIREAMFGGEFGAFGSRGVHFFDESSPLYQGLSGLLRVRQEQLCLRRGRQYLRQISGDGENFDFPRPIEGRMRSIVAWSRTLSDHEVVVAINTDPDASVTAWVTIDGEMHHDEKVLRCVFSTDEDMVGCPYEIEPKNGLAIQITLPPAGVAVFRG